MKRNPTINTQESADKACELIKSGLAYIDERDGDKTFFVSKSGSAASESLVCPGYRSLLRQAVNKEHH